MATQRLRLARVAGARRRDGAGSRPIIIKWSKFSGASWTKDGSGFYYGRFDAPKAGDELQGVNKNQKVYFHKIGTPQDADTLVYERPDQARPGVRSRRSPKTAGGCSSLRVKAPSARTASSCRTCRSPAARSRRSSTSSTPPTPWSATTATDLLRAHRQGRAALPPGRHRSRQARAAPTGRRSLPRGRTATSSAASTCSAIVRR